MGERPHRTVATAAAALMMACAPVALSGPGCSVRSSVALPDALDESSGVAVGLADPSVLWSHNDDGSRLFALDSAGGVLDVWSIRPTLRDWEDLASAPCEAHGSCLYLADTGDNAERRPAGHVRLARIAEPTVMDPTAEGGGGAARVLQAETFPIQLPDGPRDIEGLFVLPGEQLYLVTKGRNHAITVYRYPPPLRPDTVTLEEIQRLTGGPQPLANQVTGAAAHRDGTSIAIRTYQTMAFYRMVADTLEPVEDGFVNLRILRESQGEAVALGPNGLVVLTSEAGFLGAPPTMNLLRCGA